MWYWVLIYVVWRTLRYCFQTYTLKRTQREYTPFRQVNVQEKLPLATKRPIVVTGGAGFLGSKIIEYLLLQGESNIWLFDVVPPSKVYDARVQFRQCDIQNRSQVFSLIAEASPTTIYHVAAFMCFAHTQPHQWRRAYAINVQGTVNLRDASLKYNVARFIYTSSSTVSVSKTNAHQNMTEEDPYVTKSTTLSHYQLTKALAEKCIRESHGKRLANGEKLQTIVVRPTSMVFGAGEKCGPLSLALNTYFAPLLNPKTMLDVVSVENVAYGELLAEYALRTQPSEVGGEAFCISNADPVCWADLYLLLQLHQRIILVTLMPWMYLSFACLSEIVQWVFRGRVSLGSLDQLSLATVALSLREYTFRPEKAKNLLGYEPLYTLEQGLENLYHAWSQGQ